ncbi:MAG TPA: redoxin domain-containing protein [Polyangiaceae bacterium]|nr:redoxin domain-containing protein [Polyangiaceae bacterium]
MRFNARDRGALLLLAFAASGAACSRASAGAEAAHAPPAQLAAHAPSPAPTPEPSPTSDARVSAELDAASASGAESAPRAFAPRPAAERGWLGVELAMRQADEPGVLVRDVVRGSPAASAGVAAGDVIISVDGENVARPDDVSRLVAVRGAGQRLRLGFVRGTETRLLAIELERFPNNDEIMRRQYVGMQAPEFDALETAQGSVEPRLAKLRGKVVVLEFWASWCGPCHLLSPVLEAWHERFTPQGVVVAGVAAETMPVVTRSASQMGIAYPLFADPSGATTKAYRAMALPTVFVLDKGGRVRDVMVGYSSPGLARLESLVKRLIEES